MTPVAITQRQPFASLLAHGIAEWHTSRARPRLEPGQEVWVVSGSRWAKGWLRWYNPDHADDAARMDLFERLGVMMSEDPGGSYSYYPWKPDLPLGAVLSRHRLAEVVPVGIHVNTDGDRANGPFVYPSNGDAADLYIWKWGGQWYDRLHDVSDQLPYADWSPGRWAWRLELIERLEVAVAEYPVPVDDAGCSTSYCFGATGAEMEQYPICKGCNYDGTRMVPVRGRPGIWHPDRGLIAAVRGEGG